MEYWEVRRDPDHMPYTGIVSITHESSDALRRKIIGLCPAAAAIAYPLLLQAFHAAVSPPGGALSGARIAGAAILLALAFAMPLSGLASDVWWTAAVLITFYVLFHLTNHLAGLIGPETHAAIVNAGRAVYRAPLSEPVLVLALLFQAASGARLAWHWSGLRTDAYRIFRSAPAPISRPFCWRI
jgi:hypothetical protein